MKKNRDLLETSKNFLNSVTVPKNVKGGPFRIFSHPFHCKILNQMKGNPSVQSKNFQKKSHSAEKIIVPKKSEKHHDTQTGDP